MHPPRLKLMSAFRLSAHACLLAVTVTGCDLYERPKLDITEPSRGSIFPASDTLQVKISGDSKDLKRVRVNGTEQTPVEGSGSGEHTYILPVASGLNYVSASLPDDPYIVTRSWLQGDVVPTSEWYPDTLTIRFSGDILNGDQGSLAHLIEASLRAVDLARFVPLIEIDLGISSAEIEIESARVKDVDLKLKVDDQELRVEVELSRVDLEYRLDSDLLDSSGEGRYSEITATAEAEIETSGVSLVNLDVDISRLNVDDDNLPGYLVDPLIDALRGKFRDAITQAIIDATREITGQLFDQLDPQLGLALPKPIRQETQLVEVSARNDGLELQYQTRVSAVSPRIAKSTHGALLAAPPQQPSPSEQSAITVGAPLVNQLAFAVWDAGNLEGLSYSRAQLERLGLGELNFPYSNLERADVKLLLPPIMEWDELGPYIDVGGIQIDIKVDLSKDTRAWTAARIPVVLQYDAGALRLSPDMSRSITVQPIMLSRLNVIAERDEVLKLTRAALPGVVGDVFGRLPLITIPPLELRVFNETVTFSVTPHVVGAQQRADYWRVDFDLMVTQLE